MSASSIFKGAALEGLSNRGGYLPDFTVLEFTRYCLNIHHTCTPHIVMVRCLSTAQIFFFSQLFLVECMVLKKMSQIIVTKHCM